MEKIIPVSPGQIKIINEIIAKKNAILKEEKDILTFVIAGADVDASKVERITIRDNDVVVNLRQDTEKAE